ncbi:MAG: enoyl-CoA hydratase/isomerase family protein [Rhodospirillales bacterium]
MQRTVEVERQAGVATLWMNRPDLHNAFDATLIAELTAALCTLDGDPEIRAVVLAGRGESFCAGADVNWMRGAATFTEAENRRDATALAQMLRMLALLSKPTVARIHGAAIGGGLGLVSAADIAIASSRAVFATPEVRLGLIPATIGPHVVAAIGERQARRYFLTAERISAVRAQAIGLVHEVVEPEQLDAAVAKIVAALLAGGPKAQQASKELLREIAGQPLSEALALATAERIARLRLTVEAAEGLGAFLEKRPPAWIGSS